jgi:hypothetical protein
VRRTDGQKLVIRSAEPSSKQVQVRVEPSEPANDQSAKLVVTIQNDGTPRRLNDNVKVYLEGIPQPAATVSVFGQLQGDVSVTPEQLYWPITDPSRSAQPVPESQTIRRVAVASTRADQALEVKNLSSSLKDLSVELVTEVTGKTYSVVAKFAAAPKESERGTISFETNTSSQPKITIPVTVTVLK